MDEPPLEESEVSPKPTFYAWIVLLIITSIAMLNQWQRYVISYANGWKGDIGSWKAGDPKYEISSEFEQWNKPYGYGILSGLAFTLSYACCGIFAGVLSDKVNRKLMMSVAAILWSVCTLLSGLIHNFWLLYVFRFFLGIFESAFAPCAYGIIADYFHPESRGTANSIYNLGIYFGGALSSIGILLISNIGWANTYSLIGFIGIGTGVLGLVFVLEPKRGKFEKKKTGEAAAKVDTRSPLEKFMNSATEIVANPTCRWACIGASMRFFGGYAIGFYMPKYFGTVYSSNKDTYGIANAFVVSMCGLVSSLTGGILSDKYEQKGYLMTKAYICVFSAVLGIPTIGMCCLFQNSFWFSMISLGLEYLVAECWLSPCITMLLNTISPENKGFAVSAFLFAATIAGTISTALAGAIGSAYSTTTDKENYYLNGWILCGFVIFSYGGSIPFMLLAGKSYTKFKQAEKAEKERLELLAGHNNQNDY